MDQNIENIRNCYDSCSHWDSFQTSVAAAIPTLMVTQRDLCRLLEQRMVNTSQKFPSYGRVRFDCFEFGFCQFGRFQQNSIGNCYLAHIVKRSGQS
jgi:hypothetical protein